ncbi:hypothetical protein MMC13_005953 [Lambiella insularis]|nr:hypothetical protein [Lambiella insularis]
MQPRSGNGRRNEPIAIIGSGCRFPGECSTPSRLWELLREPRDLLSRIPGDRFNAEGFYHPDGQYHGNSNVRDSYFLSENHRQFDAQFFEVKPIEANATDPQQRLLLETVYECIESAGLTIEGLRGSKTAVYVGLMCADYDSLLLRDADSIPTYHATGVSRSIMSNRISYFFDWRGPSMTIDTACSSSLVAVHQAVQVLRSGDSRVAVAAGSNLILGPENYIGESKLKMLSPDGRSRMWDADANGYARGEGVAAIVMKTLSAALEDGDHIECIIRETGINQDGRTKGITMPSATSQAALIRETYAKAGLDLTTVRDRCQYFEAHGTGTPAGDPIEAEAISIAFFNGSRPSTPGSEDDLAAANPISHHNILYVGSIKTVIGHTEGTAGLAAIFKASLSLLNRTIPPNLLFKRLNSAIEPFARNLEVPTKAIPWPAVPEGQPRRASVNSFGFGGTNAHAILESYDPTNVPLHQNHVLESAECFLPFVLSANSERSLASRLTAYSTELKVHKSLSLCDLAWTLYARRSVLPVKIAFSAASVESLCTKLDQKLEVARAGADANIGIRSNIPPNSARILGVFTGQGAQWARMGRDLVSRSEYVRNVLEDLENRLAQLPIADRPSWSLVHELLAETSSNINGAALSQPLCTAIQIVLVKLLRSVGIQFTAIVGHSSGEIGAAYAAGLISARDAICVAYYRGVHTKLARGPGGQDGSMLAVGTSFEDAQELCTLPFFQGRMVVAASNSSTSVTLSGDSDAIRHAKIVLEDEKKFVRLLVVDKAYHSHHMAPCTDAYVRSLHACNIKVLHPGHRTGSWLSSVSGQELSNVNETLKDTYWSDNMASPVCFSQAIEKAFVVHGPFDVAIEVGPHPALKGPVTQTIQELSGGLSPIPYTGLLKRGMNDDEAVADGLGYLWTYLGNSGPNLRAYDELMRGDQKHRVLKDLPPYSWDHDREFWQESRLSRAFRTRSRPTHLLLGNMRPDGTQQQLQWRNLLRPKEIPWLDGHKLQEQTVFPAAGYIVMALEASKALAGVEAVRLITVQDLVIHQAMVFQNDESEVETIFTLTDISHETKDVIQATFMYYSAVGKDIDSMTLMASGKLEVSVGESMVEILPSRTSSEPNMIDIDVDLFYTSLANIGYGYTGPFRALSSMKRKLGRSTGVVFQAASSDLQRTLLVHPAMLDAAIQSVILAYCYPNDGRLWSIYVPTTIQKVTVNPSLCVQYHDKDVYLQFDAALPFDDELALHGDVDVYSEDGCQAMLQVEGVHCVPFTGPTAADDTRLFSAVSWSTAVPSGDAVSWDGRATAKEYELALNLERLCYFYLRNLEKEIPRDHPARVGGWTKKLFGFVADVLSSVSSGRHQYAKTEWENDTLEQVLVPLQRYAGSVDLRIVQVVGEQISKVIKGETTILEHLMQDNLLTSYYSNAMGFDVYTRYLARMVGQLTNRYPHMNILEIGAGTGAATKGIFKEVGNTFSSYTYTDIGIGFFETAMEVFKVYSAQMKFKVLDIEKDVEAQGFAESSFDLIIASWVIHATAKLENTLRNVRRLLKPGGYLLMLEVTDNGPMKSSFIFGSLPGWWLGSEDGRVLSPCVSPAHWDSVLRKTGFSGIDAITPEHDRLPYPASLIASQAIDDRLSFLRHPLSPAPESLRSGLSGNSLLILGGKTLITSRLLADLKIFLRPFFCQTHSTDSLSELSTLELPSRTTVLSLVDLDEPVFKNLTTEKFEGLKNVFERAKTILWITRGRRADEPYANMTVGFGRTQLWENPELRLQFMDIESREIGNAYQLAEALLRFDILSTWSPEMRQDLLWSIEPELLHCSEGFMIPRLLSNCQQNNRYNSSRRYITKDVDPRKTPVVISQSHSSYVLLEDGEIGLRDHCDTENSVVIHTQFSLLSSIKIEENGYLYLLFGTTIGNGEQVLCLSETHTSIAMIPQKWKIPCHVPVGQEVQFVSSVASNLLALSIVLLLSSGETLLVHEPESSFAAILARHAAERSVDVLYTTTNIDSRGSPWVSVHPRAPQRVTKGLLPQRIAVFINFSNSTESNNIASSIAACLPPHCKQDSAATLFRHESHVSSAHSGESVHNLLRAAWLYSHEDISMHVDSETSNGLALDALSQTAHSASPQNSVVDWTVTPTIQVQVQPVDARPLFAKNKTYWLVGLTQGLGLSLCEWMIRHGAKFVVLTSRNPKIDKRWFKKMEALGATVRCFANDITDKNNLQVLYKEICSTLPPIAGIAQGAMVLEDTLTRDMSLETMLKVLRPKVIGSIHLDELFPDDTLDFFIFLSSMASIIGNIGQSNYSAANEFMTSLAGQRRKRGLAASVINIGIIVGVGYITREVGQQSEDILIEGGHTRMSERALHQIFAEGVLASHPRSGYEPEISTGLRHISPDEAYKPLWFDNPKFSHQILHQVAADVGRDTTKTSAPIKTQLLTATRRDHIYDILKEAFVSKLHSSLQLTYDDADRSASILQLRTDEMGIDSLIAVEIRTWFLKNLEVNMPVLKILGGASIGELLDHAVEHLPPKLTPNLNDDPAIAERREVPVGQHTSETTSVSDSPGGSSSQTELESSASESEIKPFTTSIAWERRAVMSFSQSMFWFVKVYLEDQTTLNHTGCYLVKGKLRVADLERAVLAVAQRHEALRTCFFMDESGSSIQAVKQSTSLCLETKVIKEQADVAKEFALMKNHVFDIERGSTMRILLLAYSPTDHYLIIGCHHINMDGISQQVLMSDLEKAYDRQRLSPEVLQYPDFSNSQREDYKAGKWGQEISYWRKEFPDFPPTLPLLSLSKRVSRQPLSAYDVHRKDFRLNSTLTAQVLKTCRQCKATPFHFYLAAFRALLYRYTGSEDLCIGIGDGNRTEDRMLESIGPYINLLPLRFHPNSTQTFTHTLRETRAKTYSALANSRLPFDVLLNELSVPRSAGHSPLFQTFVDYRQGARERQSFGNCELETVDFEAGRTAYDISLDIVDNTGQDCLLMLMVQKDLYGSKDAEILMKAYTDLIASFAKSPSLPVGEPELYREVDIEKAIAIGRGPTCVSQWPETLVHRIDICTEQYGDRPAVKDGKSNILTYTEMAARVNSIASTLLVAGLEAGSRVAVYQEPTSDWICSLLAIMRIGAVYIPLDLATPLSRLAVIVNDCRPSGILVHNDTEQQSVGLNALYSRMMNVSNIVSSNIVAVPIMARSESPAVILYTSGSTGIPKGVVLKHSNLRNEIECSAKIYQFNCEIVLQQSALSFDMSLTQIFTAIAFGGMVYIVPKNLRGDSSGLTKLIASEGVSLTGATPSEYLSWLHHDASGSLKSSRWALAICGGEQVTTALMETFRSLKKPDLRLFNAYGPTEVTCSSNKMELFYFQEDFNHGHIAAGYSSPNCSVYIVDNNLKPVPIGVPGEVLVGGAGVSFGYLDKEMTMKKFILDVFATAEQLSCGWTSMYRTGDWGRWRDDGTIIIERRIAGDTQIKLRGLRFELHDIENSILETAEGALIEAVVSARGTNDWDPEFLVAHVVFSPNFPPERQESCLKRVQSSLPLPQYMHPAMVIPVSQLILNSSSKVDRIAIGALPLPECLAKGTTSVELTTNELQLKKIWEEVLPKDTVKYYSINAETDFFHVGGNSMLLLNLQVLVQKTTGVTVPLIQLFESSTIRSMALRIENSTSRPVMVLIDWDHETELSQDLPQRSMSTDVVSVAVAPKIVVLTGATGFVGKGLLQCLIEDGNIQKIYCIAVRDITKMSLFMNCEKVVICQGDLQSPRLGLSELDAASIFWEADAIIHNGADVSHLKTYQTLKGANLESTKELVKMGLWRQVPFHYVSTAGVAMFSGADTFEEISAAPYLPPMDGSDGYTATKWASERFLEKVNEHCKLPVWIHRPSSIIREDTPELDIFQNILKFSRLSRSIPESQKLHGALDLVSLNTVAGNIVRELHRKPQPSVVYLNHTGDIDLPLSALKAFLERESAADFTVLPMNTWAAKAESLGLHATLVAYFQNLETMAPITFPRYLKTVAC